MIVALLGLILGLLLGFYGRAIYNRLDALYEQKKDEREAKNVGVVRIRGVRGSRDQPIDLSSDTGSVLRPSPAKVEDQRQAERAQMLQDNHR